MTEWGNMSEVGWKKVGLVVFDLDGTLYDQPPLRRAMAIELCKHSLRQRSLRTVRTLRAFRQIRELLGEVQGDDFTHEQFSLTSRRCGCSEGEIRAMVEEWIERRPLALLPRYKARGIDRLFSALRAPGGGSRSGRTTRWTPSSPRWGCVATIRSGPARAGSAASSPTPPACWRCSPKPA